MSTITALVDLLGPSKSKQYRPAPGFVGSTRHCRTCMVTWQHPALHAEPEQLVCWICGGPGREGSIGAITWDAHRPQGVET